VKQLTRYDDAPFDRLLVAQAMTWPLRPLTADATLAR
jgi:PIN domain nuclease of toxin-antitoxin system